MFSETAARRLNTGSRHNSVFHTVHDFHVTRSLALSLSSSTLSTMGASKLHESKYPNRHSPNHRQTIDQTASRTAIV